MSQVSIFVKGSIIDLYGQPATPANPPVGQARMFYNSVTDVFEVIDSNGVVILSGGASTPGVIANTILTANNIVIGAGANAVQDSGTALNSVALLSSPAFTNNPTAPTQSAFSNDTKLSTDAYADNNFKGVSVTGFREDFQGSGVNSFTVLGSTGSVVFDGPWSSHNITGGTTGTIAPTSAVFANPGQAIFTCVATSGDGISLFKSGATSIGALGSNAGWEINFIVKLAQTTNVCIRIGAMALGQVTSDSPPNDGMWIEYDTANASSSSDFTWVTAKSGSGTSYSTTDAIGADTSFHHFRIRSTIPGTIGFTVDGGTEFTTSADISTSVLAPVMQIVPRTNAAQTMTMDFFSYMAATGRT